MEDKNAIIIFVHLRVKARDKIVVTNWLNQQIGKQGRSHTYINIQLIHGTKFHGLKLTYTNVCVKQSEGKKIEQKRP